MFRILHASPLCIDIRNHHPPPPPPSVVESRNYAISGSIKELKGVINYLKCFRFQYILVLRFGFFQNS
jgi:hypothetical protein